jgi:ribosomal protein S18 acetylase RimI-like enzyme
LITQAEPPPAAWVRAAAVGDRGPATEVMRLLVSACLPALSDRGIATLSILGTEPWLGPVLDELGFAVLEQVESWGKEDLRCARLGARGVEVRPARLDELAHLAHLDQAAFAARWHHSSEMLALAWKQVVSFTVAIRGGAIVGFQLSLAHGDQAHLARLAVLPAAQRSGVGSRLLADAFERYAALGLKRVSLNTQSGNLASHRLYSAFGFQRVSPPVPVWERSVG